MNILKLGQGLAKCLPMSEGCASTVKLSKQGIEALAKKNPELGNILSGITEGAANPTLEIMHKAQGNYAIAGFRIKSGETVLGKGAYSTSNGANGVVEKMHFEKGDVITTISKEGKAEPIISETSKTELAKAAQERAKASEYMTTETLGKNGERILKRKLHNGDKVEMTIHKDGIIRTKITKPDGKWYAREKFYTTTEFTPDEEKVLHQIFPRDYLYFRRLDKNVRLYNPRNEFVGVEMPKSGRLYGINLDSLDDVKLLEYNGRRSHIGEKPVLYGYTVREFDGTTPVGVIKLDLHAKDRNGYPTIAIEDQEKLNGWNKLANVYPRDLRSILP